MRFAKDSVEATDVRAALAKASMLWTPQFKPLLVETNDGFGTTEVQSHRALVRSDNGRVVGIHGGAYTPVSTIDAFSGPLGALVESGAARIVEASEWQGGSKVSVTAEITGTERPITRKVGDVLSLRITFTNSHDGTSKTLGRYGALRLVCLNGAAAFENSAAFSARHTKGVHVKLEAWQVEIAQQVESYDKRVEAFRAMARRRLNDRALRSFIRETLSEGAGSDESITVRGVDRIIQLAHEAPGADPGSLWGGLNAVTYWATHERGNSDDSRAVANIFGNGMQLVERATALATRAIERLPLLELGRESYANHATASSEFGALLGRPARISHEPTVIDSPAE
jgi:Domain of unknown function (DUF932)